MLRIILRDPWRIFWIKTTGWILDDVVKSEKEFLKESLDEIDFFKQFFKRFPRHSLVDILEDSLEEFLKESLMENLKTTCWRYFEFLVFWRHPWKIFRKFLGRISARIHGELFMKIHAKVWRDSSKTFRRNLLMNFSRSLRNCWGNSSINFWKNQWCMLNQGFTLKNRWINFQRIFLRIYTTISEANHGRLSKEFKKKYLNQILD